MAETHAVLSPSSADRWMQCPGSVLLTADVEDSGSGAAAEGTMAHEVAALCLTSGTGAAAYIGRVFEIDGRDLEFTAEHANDLQVYVDLVRDRVKGYELAGAFVTLEVEQRVPVGHLTLEPGAEGTSDAVIIAEFPDTRVLIEVIDLKFGRRHKVEAQDNRQLRLYALGAVEKFGLLFTFTDAKVTISQPRVSQTPSEWELPMGELLAFGREVNNAAHGVRAARICFEANTGGFAEKYLAPSDDACLWCSAKGKCPALQTHVATTVLDDFEDLSQEGVAQAVEAVPQRTPDQLAVALLTVDLIESWCKAVRAEGFARLLTANNDPATIEALGFKLVEGRQGNREWADEAEAEKALKSMRLKQEEMYEFVLIGPTAAEKLAPKYGKDGKPKADQPESRLGDRQWKKLQPLITRKAPGLSMVPASDKKPAKVLAATVDDFEDISEAEDIT